MSFTFGSQGFKRKVVKKARAGGKGAMRWVPRDFQSRRQMTPNQLAASNLSKELAAGYPGIPEEQRNVLRRRMEELDQIRTMNMRYLAGALYIVEELKVKESSAAMFAGPIWEFVVKRLALTSSMNAEAAVQPSMLTKYKEELLVYILRILPIAVVDPAAATVIDDPEVQEVDTDPDEDLPLPVG
jgi:hypothetical protein